MLFFLKEKMSRYSKELKYKY